MVTVHTFVAEVLAYLVHPFEATHDESLQVELGGDTHIHILIEGIEVCDEWPCRGSSGNHLQRGCLHFGISCFVQNFPHGPDDSRTLEECVFDTLVDHKIDVALTIAQLGIVELVIGDTILVFHDWQRLQSLRQQCQLLGVHADLSRLGTEHEALYANKVADVEQTLENIII